MKKDIHPDYMECTVRCSCGNEFTTRSTKPELRIDICNVCHPFYSGTQKLIDTGGRVQRFSDRFGSAADAAKRNAEKKAARAAQSAEREAAKKAEREAKAAKKAERKAKYEEEAAKAAEKAATEEAIQEDIDNDVTAEQGDVVEPSAEVQDEAVAEEAAEAE